MLSSQKFLRHCAIKVGAVVVAAVLLWCGLWALAAYQNEKFVNSWIDAERGKGHMLTFDSQSSGGFPFYNFQSFTNLRWRKGLDENAGAQKVTICSYPWSWRKFYVSFENTHDMAITFGKHKIKLIAEAGNAKIVFDSDGGIAAIKIGLANSHTNMGGKPWFDSQAIEALVGLPKQNPQSHADIGLTIHGKFQGLKLLTKKAMPFGDKIELGDFSARLMGSIPASLDKKSLAAWNEKNSVIEVDNIKLNWGELKLAANGTIALGTNLQPEGAFSGRIENYKAAIDALEKSKLMDEKAVKVLNSALDAIVKANGQNVGADIDMPIAIQQGGFFLGPALVFTVPELEWDLKSD